MGSAGRRWLLLLATLAVSAAGGGAAALLDLPAGWLSGGLVAVAAASLAGLRTEVPPPIRTPVYFLLGIYAGSGVSHDTLHQMRTWPVSFLILAASIGLLLSSSYLYLHRRRGWEPSAALLASVPGALSFVMAVAERWPADLKKVAIAQSIRLLLLVELVPLVALVIGHTPEIGGPSPRPSAGPQDFALILGVGLAAVLLFRRIGLPGAEMLGGLLASASLLLSGTVSARLPDWLLTVLMIAMAAIAGSRFRPGDLAILPRIAGAALGAFAIALGVSVAAAALATLLLGVNFLQALLAFAPGAQEAVTVLAFAMDLDPAYVAAHHVVRFLGLVALMPFFARFIARRS